MDEYGSEMGVKGVEEELKGDWEGRRGLGRWN